MEKYQITVIGAGAAGLVVAKGAAMAGKIAKQFEKEGIKLYLNTSLQTVQYINHLFHLSLENQPILQVEQLLIAIGHQPNLSSLNLEKVGVNYTEKGVLIDAYGRTNKRHIWAIGDCIGPPFFSHAAEHQARAVLTSLLIPLFNKKWDQQPIPRATFTDPEVAAVGLSEKEAKEKYRSIAIYVVPFSSIDRAITTGQTDGFVKIVTKKWSCRVLGATLVGEGASELLSQISMAIHLGIPLRKMASIIYPYPTYSLALRHAADLWIKQTLFSTVKKYLKKRQKGEDIF